MKYITLFVPLIFSVHITNAQVEKIDTDRPDQTESAYLVPGKWLQFEMGFNKQGSRPGNINEYLLPTLLSKYGVNKNFELRLITTVQSAQYRLGTNTTNQTGLEPVEIGAKIRLAEERGILPKTSLIFHFAIPSFASKNLRTNKVAPNFRFTMQNSITKNMAIGYNLGAEWDGYSNKPTWIYTFAPGFNLSERWYGYIEAFGFISSEAPAQHSADAGIAWYANNNVKIDFSGGLGISSNAPPYYVSVGASVRLNTTKK